MRVIEEKKIVTDFYKSLLENISDGIILMDTKEKVLYANKTLVKILELNPQDILSKKIPEFISFIKDPALSNIFLQIESHLFEKKYIHAFTIKKNEISYLIEVRIDNKLDVADLNAIVITFKRERVDKTYFKSFEESQKRIWKQNQAIVNIGKYSFWESGDIQQCFISIADIASKTFDVERVSIWMNEKNVLKCKYLLDKNNNATCSLISISEKDFPNYFQALNNNEIIDAENALEDERTREYSENYLIPLGISSVLDTPIRIGGVMMGMLSLEHVGPKRHWHIEEKTFAVSLSDLIALAIASADRRKALDELIEKVLEQEKTLDLFKRYVPAEIVEKALDAKEISNIFEGELLNVVVLFCDIRNFTSISEMLPPKEVVKLLNTYYTIMSDAVKKYKGSINQYVGDEIFAAFGAPVAYKDNELNAVLCALEMVDKIVELNKIYEKQTGRKIEVGIGINSGEAVAGNLGSEDKIEYSITGDTVNTGKRIEMLTKDDPNKILISETVYEKVKDHVETIAWAPMEVKGKASKITVYEVAKKK